MRSALASYACQVLYGPPLMKGVKRSSWERYTSISSTHMLKRRSVTPFSGSLVGGYILMGAMAAGF